MLCLIFHLINVISLHVNPSKILINKLLILEFLLLDSSLVPDDPLGGENEEDAAQTEERHGEAEALLDGEVVQHFRTVVTVVSLEL